MIDNVSDIFDKNTRVLNGIGKAIIKTREGNYEDAIEEISKVSEDISYIADSIMRNREYFELVSVESIGEMLEGIIEAKQKQDYILLADLLELQMENFICSVQNYIMNKEELQTFEESKYQEQIVKLQKKVVNQDFFWKDFKEELNTSDLLEEGYRIEITSCGLMTLAAKDKNKIAHYLHTNHKISQEAFLLARTWSDPSITTYVIYGLGLGYHIIELIQLNQDASFEIYEGDMNILKLCCAFSNIEIILSNPNVKVIYDKDCSQFKKRIQLLQTHEKLCIHRPSYERVVDNN